MAEGAGSTLVVDTHVWIWLMEGRRDQLSAPAIDEVERAATRGAVRVSAISVWEVAMLEAKDRIRLARPLQEWVRAGLRAPGVRLMPLSPEIAVESTRLPGDPNGDPADRILIASARVADGRLVTCDRDIVAYSGAGHVAVLDARA